MRRRASSDSEARTRTRRPPPLVTPPSPSIEAPSETLIPPLLRSRVSESQEAEPETLASELLQEPIFGNVRILFLDVDGTLTDGVIGFDREGDSRNFWVRDGIALEWARDLGVLTVALSGRDSKAVAARCLELRLEAYLGIQDKVVVAETVLKREGARWEQCVMVGDDLPDIPMMKRVGWPIAVADATAETRAVAKTILGTRGGRGAVREVVEMVLRHNGVWDQVLRRYEAL
jgi:3-deoxy-D-manno-octulosonate 8-phosphate phosphatase (KDO 8-P phosphatase)